MPHPNSIANLKPWGKGQSGNRKGRPPEPFRDEMRKLARKKIPGSDMSYRQAIVLGLARAAIKGDVTAARAYIEQTEGKATQPVDVSGQVQVVIDL